MIVLLWGGAFAVDLGLTTVGNRQMQAMADTAALDVARYVDIVDTSATLGGVTNGLVPSTNYLNGKLANADTDNGSSATLSETPGVWLNGVFTPENSKVVVGKITETVYCWDYKPVLPQPCNADQGHGDTDGATDFRGRPTHGDQVLHCGGRAGSRLRHRFLSRLRQLATVRRP